MSSTPQHWLKVYENKKNIYAAMKQPISIQEIADITGIDYATIHNNVKQMVRWADIKILPKKVYAGNWRIQYVAAKNDYTETIPSYVTKFLNKVIPAETPLPSHVRRIVFDDSTEYGKELCKKLAITYRTQRANDKVCVSGGTLA